MITTHMTYTERMNIIREEITTVVERLMSSNNRGQYQLTGTKTDLIELLHVAYLESGLHEPDGRPARFSYIIDKAFHALDLSIPSNPSKAVTRANAKQGVKSVSAVDRLIYCISHNTQDVFWQGMIRENMHVP